LAIQTVTQTHDVYCSYSVACFELGYAIQLVKWHTFHQEVKRNELVAY